MKKTLSTILLTVLVAALMASSVAAVGFANIWSDNEHGSYLAAYAGDGDETLFWHTDWENGITEPPFNIYFELDGTYAVSSVGILPRQDGNFNGLIYVFNLYMSEDGENYTLVKEVTDFVNDPEVQTVTLDAPVNAKFIRIEAIETEGVSFASINELIVTGEPAAAPAPAAVEEPAVEAPVEKGEPDPAPAVEAAPVPESAPATFDINVALSALVIMAVAAFAIIRKRHSAV
jgi:F5/8 type C domain.